MTGTLPSRMRWRSQPRCASLAFLLLLVALSCPLSTQAQTAEQQKEVNTKMNDLVDSVKEAVHDAEAAAGKRQVVDLGQSLHLLESKFTGLRTALLQEMGASKDRMTSHAGVSTELLDKSASLVKSVVKQRDELRKLSSEMREVDSAVRALREGLSTFEKEVNDLTKVLGDLHITHNELSSSHSDTKQKIHSVILARHNDQPGAMRKFMFLLVAVEVIGFAAYLYMKKPSRAFAHKAYGKFG